MLTYGTRPALLELMEEGRILAVFLREGAYLEDLGTYGLGALPRIDTLILFEAVPPGPTPPARGLRTTSRGALLARIPQTEGRGHSPTVLR